MGKTSIIGIDLVEEEKIGDDSKNVTLAKVKKKIMQGWWITIKSFFQFEIS